VASDRLTLASGRRLLFAALALGAAALAGRAKLFLNADEVIDS
jgi:hypothetical protein